MREQFVTKRMVHYLQIDVATLLLTAALCFWNDVLLDEFLVYVIFDLIFLVLFHYILVNERLSGRLAKDREHDLGSVSHAYLLLCMFAAVISFLPEFAKPVIVIAILMEACGNVLIASSSGFFLSCLLTLTSRAGTQELIMQIMLVLFGSVLAEQMEQHLRETKKLLVYYAMILCVNISFSALFSYVYYWESDLIYPLYGACSGFFTIVVLLLCFRRMGQKKQSEVTDKLSSLLDEQYQLAQELKNFSKAEYQHARRVSKIAAECAAYVHADANVCAAAGMYYRIGILDGEPLTKTSAQIARKFCFPEEVTQIISEYGGEEALPSNVESAIVHMVDGTLKKMEVLPKKSTEGKWNQDMIIYQTLNDYSSGGLYDRSGLSMNMFIKIREYLLEHLMTGKDEKNP